MTSVTQRIYMEGFSATLACTRQSKQIDLTTEMICSDR